MMAYHESTRDSNMKGYIGKGMYNMTWGSVLQFAADQLQRKTRDLEQVWRARRSATSCPRAHREMMEDPYLQGQAGRYAFKIKRRIRTIESIRREIGEFKAAFNLIVRKKEEKGAQVVRTLSIGIPAGVKLLKSYSDWSE